MFWEVEDGEPYLTVRTRGRFNVEDHRAMVRDILARPFWRPGRNVLFDHRALSFEGTDYAAMTAAVHTHQLYDREIGPGRAAILTAGPADYGLIRIFDALAGDNVLAQLEAFTDERAARAWLTTP